VSTAWNEGDMLTPMGSPPTPVPAESHARWSSEQEPWDPAAPGRTDETSWRRALESRPERAITGWRSVVVVAPHPDDETIGVGATIAALARRGARVRMLFLTDGEASHPGTADLRERRTDEAARALDALGVPGGGAERLGRRDGGLAGGIDDLALAIAARIRGDDIVLSTWPGDGHPDHRAAGIAAGHAARQAGAEGWWYPVWAWHHEGVDGRMLRSAERVPVTAADLAAKRKALGAYRSQLTDVLGPPIVPLGFLRHHLRPFEVVLPCT